MQASAVSTFTGMDILVIKSAVQAMRYLKPYSATNILAKQLYMVPSAYLLKYDSNIVFPIFYSLPTLSI